MQIQAKQARTYRAVHSAFLVFWVLVGIIDAEGVWKHALERSVALYVFYGLMAAYCVSRVYANACAVAHYHALLTDKENKP